MELERKSWLIQRLQKLTGETMLEPTKTWALDKEGKVSREGAELRGKLFSYDYMGSSEFEDGSIGRAISTLIKGKPLIAFPIDCQVVWREWTPGGTGDCMKSRNLPIYIICRDAQSASVEARVKELMSQQRPVLKESLFKEKAFATTERRGERPGIVGWMELDNGFYFFAQKKQWQYMTKLLTGKMPP